MHNRGPEEESLVQVEYVSPAQFAKNHLHSTLAPLAHTLSERASWEWADEDTGELLECEIRFLMNAAPLTEVPCDPSQGAPESEMTLNDDGGEFLTLVRRDEHEIAFPSKQEMLEWAKNAGFQIGDHVMSDPTWRPKILQLCWMW